MFALTLITTAILAAPLGQVDTTAAIRGAAISSYNGQPIAGVLISAPAVHKFTVTDASGRFVLRGLPSGNHAIRVSYEGRETEEYTFSLDAGQSKRISVLLDPDAVDLNPLVVEAREPNLWRDLAGFYERRTTYSGFARFFTREDIDRSRVAKVSGLLMSEGIVTLCLRYQECHPTRWNRGTLCAVPVSVDGVAQHELDYDFLGIGDVAAVEVYRGVPPADLSHSVVSTPNSSTWEGTGYPAANSGSCGLVEIWTR
ncbi:MAG TPA: carboxypeptidase-like regulatory domain-containing protein [Gemmatimonadales bacterium]|nr:carboxypeptidase-like regulatory domain-containing protein [Gemmatimonadales bacterium]